MTGGVVNFFRAGSSYKIVSRYGNAPSLSTGKRQSPIIGRNGIAPAHGLRGVRRYANVRRKGCYGAPLGYDGAEGRHVSGVQDVPRYVKWLCDKKGPICARRYGTICTIEPNERLRMLGRELELNRDIDVRNYVTARTSIKDSTIKHMLSGAREISPRSARILGKLFGVRPTWLTEGEEPREPFTAEHVDLFRAVVKLPIEQVRIFKAAVGLKS